MAANEVDDDERRVPVHARAAGGRLGPATTRRLGIAGVLLAATVALGACGVHSIMSEPTSTTYPVAPVPVIGTSGPSPSTSGASGVAPPGRASSGNS